MSLNPATGWYQQNIEQDEQETDGSGGYISESNSADTNYKRLIRAQYEHYLEQIYPNYETLIDAATSESFVDDAGDRALSASTSGFSTAKDQMDRDLRGLRVNETARQAQSRNDSFGLAQAAQTTSAVNNARLQAKDTQNQVLAGGLGSVLSSTSTNTEEDS